ncbi:MAG: hypothetical protein RL497_1171 [Pseudomonadota bacterium]|jgi:hypothetical protein
MPFKPSQHALFLFVALLCLNACSPLKTKNPNNYLLTTPADLHLSFTGRGAASSAMLMSAMGPAGIAVGLAIDVGIGKDIEKLGFAEGLNADVLFASAVGAINKPSKLFFSSKQKPHFHLQKIGFVELSGQDNLITPAIELSVVRADWKKTYRYPDDFHPAANTPLPSASLEQLKSPQSPARTLVQQALAAVLQQASADWLRAVPSA